MKSPSVKRGHRKNRFAGAQGDRPPCARVMRFFRMPSRFTRSSRITRAMARCCRARWPKFARTCATLWCSKIDGRIIGCGALHLYGVHLAEIRSITVDPSQPERRRGPAAGEGPAGTSRKAQGELRVPVYAHSGIFLAHGIHAATQHEDLPDKIHKDCFNVRGLHCCDEVAMIRGELPTFRDSASAQELGEDSGMKASRRVVKKSPLRSAPEKILLPTGIFFFGGRCRNQSQRTSRLGAGWNCRRRQRPPLSSPRIGWWPLRSKWDGASLAATWRTRARGAGELRQCQLRHRTRRQACLRAGMPRGRTLLGVPPTEVFPSSTGIIGVPFPAEKIHAKLPELIAAQSSTEQGVTEFARAIMTTDTRPKIASTQFAAGAKKVTLARGRQRRGDDSSATGDDAGIRVYRRGCQPAGTSALPARSVLTIRSIACRSTAILRPTIRCFCWPAALVACESKIVERGINFLRL